MTARSSPSEFEVPVATYLGDDDATGGASVKVPLPARATGAETALATSTSSASLDPDGITGPRYHGK